MAKQWRDFPHDDCPACGAGPEVYTDAGDGYVFDGDEARCDTCHYPGTISCDTETPAYISWCDDGYPAEALGRIEALEAQLTAANELEAALTAHNQRWLDLADSLKAQADKAFRSDDDRAECVVVQEIEKRIRQMVKEMGSE